MTARRPSVSRAVTAALKGAELEPRHAAAAALARRYAALIDDAEVLARELDDVRPEDESTAAAVVRLRAKVDAQAVASDLGPKLLAALQALGMTRSAAAAVTGGGSGVDAGGGSVSKLRDRARARRSG